jgi:hypothetical protein
MLISCLEKYLLALKCLLAAAALEKEHPKIHEQIIRFKLALDKDYASLPPKAAEVIKSEFILMPASVDLSQYNDDYLYKHKDSVLCTLSALKVRKLLSPDSASSCEEDAVAVLKLPSITLEEAKETCELLSTWNSSEVDGFRSSAAAKWTKASAFTASN